MTRWIPLTLLPLAPLLAGCFEDTEVGSQGGEPQDVVEGVALDQAPPDETPDVDESRDGLGYVGGDDLPTADEAGSTESTDADRATGSDAAKAMAAGLPVDDVKGIDDLGKDGLEVEEGVTAIAWRDLSLEGEPIEDILDKMLYPDQYEPDEYNMPERVQQLDGQEVAIVGYQIPLEWEGTKVPEFMLVGDLLGCCFGGAPMPDQWIDVTMKSEGAEYFPYIPVVVTGTLRIEGIEDEAGYAAGCYHIDAESVKKEL